MKIVAIIVSMILLVPAACLAQQAKAQPKLFSVWSIHTPEIMVVGRSPYPLATLTPTKDIVIRRVEGISNKGPLAGYSQVTGEPIACPVQYSLELSNGIVTKTISISNTFLHPKTSQTYTDSGDLRFLFPAGSRITVSLIAPKPQFPPVNCTFSGLEISVQYELADATDQKNADNQ